MDSDCDYAEIPTNELNDTIPLEGSKKRSESTIIPGQKRVRKCKFCQKSGHDSRNCSEETKGAKPRKSSSNPQSSISGPHTSDYEPPLEHIDGYETEIDSEDENNVPVAIFDEDDLEEDEEEEETEPDYSWIDIPISPVATRLSRSSRTEKASVLPSFKGKSKIDSDVQRGLGKTPNEDSFFNLFFTKNIILTFLEATNAYGKIKYPEWTSLEEAEFKAFLAVILMFGMINYNNQALAFESSEFGNSFIRSIITLSRFNQLLSIWQYEDYTKQTTEELEERKKTDPFWSIKGFVTSISQNFEKCFNPAQQLYIDKQYIPWKGFHRCRFYNPKKLEKWYFKVFSLNDCETGYMCNFYLSEGSAENRPAHIPGTEYPFHRLLDNDKFRFKTHILFAGENLSTSMNTVRYVLENGNHFIGTVKTNKKRKYLEIEEEDEDGNLTEENKKARREGKQMQTMVKVNDTIHSVYFIAWKDKNPVHMLSTIKSYLDDVNVDQINLDNTNGQWETKTIPQPSIIKTYNSRMGGKNSFEQFLRYARPQMTTLSWQSNIFIDFLNAAVFNSYVLYKLFYQKPANYHIIDFIRPLVTHLSHDERAKNVFIPSQKNKNYKQWEKDDSRFIGVHFPMKMVEPKIEKDGRRRNYQRGKCMVCGKKVPVKCKQCTTNLCVDSSLDGELTCFERFHTDKYFVTKPSHSI